MSKHKSQSSSLFLRFPPNLITRLQRTNCQSFTQMISLLSSQNLSRSPSKNIKAMNFRSTSTRCLHLSQVLNIPTGFKTTLRSLFAKETTLKWTATDLMGLTAMIWQRPLPFHRGRSRLKSKSTGDI